MKTLLITGFEPFNNEEINPSWLAVERLPEEINGYALKKLCLPVVFGEAAQRAMSVADEIKPDAILCIGQAGGRSAVTPELVAINLRFAKIPDNSGLQPKDEPIISDGENAYFSTLPVRKMADAINEAGILSNLSYSAGAYVCNDLLYTLLHNFKNTNKRIAFIHIPYCTEQNKNPSMDIDTVVKALAVAIENIDE